MGTRFWATLLRTRGLESSWAEGAVSRSRTTPSRSFTTASSSITVDKRGRKPTAIRLTPTTIPILSIKYGFDVKLITVDSNPNFERPESIINFIDFPNESFTCKASVDET